MTTSPTHRAEGSGSRSLLLSLLIYIAFFASGAGSLSAEVTWNRMLIVVVGNSLGATAMIIVVFMGGLGLGSALGGRLLATRRPSLAPYAVLEAAVGLYVLLSPALFDLLAGLFTSLAGHGGSQAALTVTRVAVTLAALLLPATLMGATFPAIISAVSEGGSRLAVRTGYLYSINTLGAAVGCFISGYHLLLEFGVRFTILCAFGVYLFAVACALLARSLGKPPSAKVEVARARGAGSETDPSPARFLAAATFGIGFVALGYEVLLTRLAILYLGNSVAVFPLVLTGFLLGTGTSAVLGTRWYGPLARFAGGDRRLFAAVSLAAGAAIMVIPYVLLSDLVLGAGEFARLPDSPPRAPGPILALITAPTLLMGALLPLAIRMLHPGERAGTTRGAAALYAWNTAGGLLGAGLVNHTLVPRVGVQGALLTMLGVCVLIALASVLSPGRRFVRWAVTAAGTGAVVAALALALPPLVRLYSAKIAASTGARSASVRLIREGKAATVTVLDQNDPSLGSYRDMYLNGVEEASTRYWHVQLFKLLGILPVLSHASDGPKQVLVIAFGAGITAGSTLASDEVESLDVVDLNPDIEGINDLFTEVNGDVFHNPRFRFHCDDGRNFLVTAGKTYDVIVNDSTHPRAYDSWILYTEEFYRAVRRRLRPDGVFAQWVPVTGSMQGRLFRIHLNTFRKVFPNSTFWYVYGSDQAFFLATPEPYVLDAPRLQAKLDRLPDWFRAREYQIDTVPRLAGFFWMDGPALERMIAGEQRVNRDDAHYFDKQSVVWPLPPRERLPFFQASILPYLRGTDEATRAAARKAQATALPLARWGFFSQKEDLLQAYAVDPENGNVRYFMSTEFPGGAPPDPASLRRREEIQAYRVMVSSHPSDPRSLNALADLLCADGQLDEAHSLAEKAVALDPDNGMILDTFGWIQYRRNELPSALATLSRAAVLLPDHPIVLYHVGAARLATGDRAGGRELLEKALRTDPMFEGSAEARELLSR